MMATETRILPGKWTIETGIFTTEVIHFHCTQVTIHERGPWVSFVENHVQIFVSCPVRMQSEA